MQNPLDPDRREILKAGLTGVAVLAVSPAIMSAAPGLPSLTAEDILKKYGSEFGPARQGD